MIIDVHAHIGWDCVYDEHFTESQQLEKHRETDIHATIVQPASCHDLDTVRAQHDAIADLAIRHPGEYFGMANPNPHLSEPVYEAELRRCVEELGFVGVKIHTAAHAVNPTGKDARKVFRLARQLNIPVMVHTGAGIPFANPVNLLPMAEAFPDVNIILAHSGMMVMAGEMPIVLERCPNVYADITWTGGFLIRSWVRKYGANRFLFGTDHADNAGTEIAKIRTCGLTADEQIWVFHKSARALYNLKGIARTEC